MVAKSVRSPKNSNRKSSASPSKMPSISTVSKASFPVLLGYHSEVWTVILTVLYSAIALYDIYWKGEAYFSSRMWYKDGFCNWKAEEDVLGKAVASFNQSFPIATDSHSIAFVSDLIQGTALVGVNAWKLQKFSKWRAARRANTSISDYVYTNSIIAVVISAFDIAHGFGHLAIHLNGGLVMDEDDLSYPLRFLSSFVFLAVAPALGYFAGVNKWLCLVLHVLQTHMFCSVPQQFAFGAVQLILNFWFCLPRLWFVGLTKKADLQRRSHPIWICMSFGGLLLMPVVFSEMLGCDHGFQKIGGHFWYDTATVVFTWIFSFIVWKSADAIIMESSSRAKKRN